MKWVKDTKQHAALHKRMIKLESLDRARESTFIIRQAGNRLGIYLDEQRICWDTIEITVTTNTSISDYPDISVPDHPRSFYFLTH